MDAILTETQQAILALIAERIEAEGMPPSQAEIARAFGFKGVRAAQYHLEALEAAGRRREDQLVIVGFQGDWLADSSLRGSGWIDDPRGTWARWQEAGADGAIVLARSTDDVDALVEAVERW